MGPIICIHRIRYLVDGYLVQIWGFSGGSAIKNLLVNVGNMGLVPGSGRSLEKEVATHSSILAGESHGQRSLTGYIQSMGSQDSDTA